MQSPTWFKRFLLATSVCTLFSVSTVFAEVSPDTMPSYTISRDYVVPTPVTPTHGAPVVEMKKYNTDEVGPFVHVSTGAKMTSKLWRGINNVLLGWVEIPKNIIVDGATIDPFTGFFKGLAVGSVRGAARTGVGAFEMVTFWSQYPVEYQPIIVPAYVLGDLTD